VFDGDLLLFRATRPKTVPLQVWAPHIQGHIEVHDIACRHDEMIEEQPLAAVAQVISERLARL
jgi:nonribosomal peptide synthetase DhbF